MSILDDILASKRETIRERKIAAPFEAMREAAATAAHAGPTRGFARALRGTRDAAGRRVAQGRLRVIAEIKKASPSKGVIRADFDAPWIARSYEVGGASAISILTDEKFFQGASEYLTAGRAACSLPVLRKDFIIDPYQVYEARAIGADAILLIAGAAPWGELAALRKLAADLGMDVLLETHDETEIPEALKLRPDALGVNNRNLRSLDFATDLGVTERVLPLVPDAQTFVSESGIHTAADVARLAALGVDAILVGEALMREPDPGAALATKLGLAAPAISRIGAV